MFTDSKGLVGLHESHWSLCVCVMCVVCRESIGQYQKALVLAEQEQKDAGMKAEALQGALKQQMKETEQASSRVSQLQKKVAEVGLAQGTAVWGRCRVGSGHCCLGFGVELAQGTAVWGRCRVGSGHCCVGFGVELAQGTAVWGSV